MESKQCQVSETSSLGLKQRTQVHHHCPGTSQQETGKNSSIPKLDRAPTQSSTPGRSLSFESWWPIQAGDW